MRAGKIFMRGRGGNGRFIKFRERIYKYYVKCLERSIKSIENFLRAHEEYNN